MKTLLTIAATSLLTLAAPAFAQDAGNPGATGSTGSLTGSNTNTGYDGTYRGDTMNRPPMNEGRASANDYYQPTGPDSPPMAGPRHSDADLVGPGSNMDSPTDSHDVAR